MICAGCGSDCTITLVVLGRGDKSHLCRKCFSAPNEVFVPRTKKGKR